MSSDTIVTTLVLDTSEADKSFDDFGAYSKAALLKASKFVGKFQDKLDLMGAGLGKTKDKFVAVGKKGVAGFAKLIRASAKLAKGIVKNNISLEKMANIVTGLASGVGLLKGAYEGLGTVVDSLIDSSRTFARGKFFGVGIKEAQRFKDLLGSSISLQKALNFQIELASIGAEKLVPEIVQASRALSFVSGLDRSEILDQLKTGAIDENALAKIGIGAGQLEMAMKRAELATGRQLSEFDKIKVILGLINKGAKVLGTTVEKLAKKDIVSPFQKLRSSINDILFGIVRGAAPALQGLLKSFGGAERIVKSITDFVEKKLVPALKGLPSQIGKALSSLKAKIASSGGVVSFLGETLQSVVFKAFTSGMENAVLWAGRSLGLDRLFGLKARRIANEQADAQAKKREAEITKRLKAYEEMQKKGAELFAFDLDGTKAVTPTKTKATTTKAKGRGVGKGVSFAQQELLAELEGFRSEARSLVRNSGAFILDAIANLGGTLSGVFASMKDLSEKFRTFNASPRFRKSVEFVLNLVNKPLVQQLKLIRQSKELTDAQKIAATGLAIQAKAGINDQDEFFEKQKLVIKQMKAGNSILESNGRLAEIAQQRFDLEIDVRKTVNAFEIAIEARMTKRVQIAKQLSKASKSNRLGLQNQIKLLDIQIARFKSQRIAYKGQQREQSILIEQSKSRILLARDLEEVILKQTGMNRLKDASLTLKKVQMDRLGLLGKLSEAGKTRFEQAQRQLEIQRRIQALLNERATFQNKLDASKGSDTDEDKRLQNQIDLRNKLIETTKKEASAQSEVDRIALEKMTTLGGAFSAKLMTFGDTARSFSAQMGDALADGFKSFVDSSMQAISMLGGHIVNVFSGLSDSSLTEKLGAIFLVFLSGLASQYAKVFAGIGAVYIAAGNYFQGAKTLAAAAGLQLIAGGLSAASSIASSPSASTGSSIAPSVGNPEDTIGQERGAETRVIFVASEAFNGSVTEQWERYTTHARDMKELTGVGL